MVITDWWGFDKIDTLFQRGYDIYIITRGKRREKGKKRKNTRNHEPRRGSAGVSETEVCIKT